MFAHYRGIEVEFPFDAGNSFCIQYGKRFFKETLGNIKI
jgi:hypothetical protein